MSNVLVLCGGSSNEREVSLRSGTAVARALERSGHTVKQHDPASGLEQAIFNNIDVVFPVLHGAGGEDGSLQEQLEDFGVRYVGSGVEASRLCFDKWRYKQLLIENHLPRPAAELVDEAGFWQSNIIKQPFVLKPFDGGSSIGMLITREEQPQPDPETIHKLFASKPKMLLEQLIEGAETTVAVLGNQALPVIEIIPPASGEFDYANKYNGQSQELCPPQHVSDNLQEHAQSLAKQIHELSGCRDLSRTDIMINKSGELFILETNTMPGMTDQSLFPKAAATAGITMDELVDQLVQFALGR